MGRSVTGLCVAMGSTAGSLVPELWGSSALSLPAVVLGLAGAVAGVWAARRLNES